MTDETLKSDSENVLAEEEILRGGGYVRTVEDYAIGFNCMRNYMAWVVYHYMPTIIDHNGPGGVARYYYNDISSLMNDNHLVNTGTYTDDMNANIIKFISVNGQTGGKMQAMLNWMLKYQMIDIALYKVAEKRIAAGEFGV